MMINFSSPLSYKGGIWYTQDSPAQGFFAHIPPHCGPSCPPCREGLRRVFWTQRPDVAKRLSHRADDTAKEAFEARDQTIRESWEADSDVDLPCPDGLAYLPYQRAGIVFALKRRGTLIADEPGLGKSIEVLGVINADPTIQSVLVVCPSSVKLNWQREAEKWLLRKWNFRIIAGRVKPDVNFAITNFERLRNERVKADLLAREWDLLVIDEVHVARGGAYTQFGQAIFGNAPYGGTMIRAGLIHRAKKLLLLTGTPMLNRPIELYYLLHAIDPEEWRSRGEFAHFYCQKQTKNGRWKMDLNAGSNLSELQRRMRGTCCIRRLKKDVLSEIPARRRQIIVLQSPERLQETLQEEMRTYKAREATLDDLDALAEDVTSQKDYAGKVNTLQRAAKIKFNDLERLRLELGLAKVKPTIQHLKAMIGNTEKVVVFCIHRAVVEKVAAGFGEKAVTITGATPMQDRQAAVDRFQTDSTCQVFVGTIGAAGVGITLTAASIVVILQLDWRPALVQQAEDRLVRIGQKKSVLVQHIVFDGSLDAKMAQAIVRKQDLSDQALDEGAGLPPLVKVSV